MHIIQISNKEEHYVNQIRNVLRELGELVNSSAIFANTSWVSKNLHETKYTSRLIFQKFQLLKNIRVLSITTDNP